MKIEFFQDRDMPEGAFHHSLRSWITVFLEDILFQGACIYTYTDRNHLVLAGIDNGLNLPSLTDVPGVYSEGINPSFDRLQGKFVIEMDVCNQRNADLRLYLVDGLSVPFV